MLLQVYDELVFDCYKAELKEMKELIKSQMEQAYELSVPMDMEVALARIGWRRIKNIK